MPIVKSELLTLLESQQTPVTANNLIEEAGLDHQGGKELRKLIEVLVTIVTPKNCTMV